jgi:hypothetical protein
MQPSILRVSNLFSRGGSEKMWQTRKWSTGLNCKPQRIGLLVFGAFTVKNFKWHKKKK